MTKRTHRRPKDSAAEEAGDEPPFGYLGTADPPRKNFALVAIAAMALVLWMGALLYLAFGSR